ncbi:unnamed protein product [Darwinula stevensoni]|uniref:Aminomethyltransferase n=1 Tax=Darwinula stevensoni TaxID=69355 RepID=A0A7R8XE60_9CRUS|nr:unnamed protein product [Darwinula stevensoni]CAG0887478.1 unnamed protein product [Darwinula stevensoni]
MVSFAGYLMPVQYGDVSISASHKHTRDHCSLFDVSHMLQTRIHGQQRKEFLESLTVCDVQGLRENHGSLSLFTNSNGGIIDDLICSSTSQGYLYVVSNAGCRDKVIPLFKGHEKEFQHLGKDSSIEFLDNFGLIALQGPEAHSILQKVVDFPVNKVRFMTTTTGNVCGIEGCRVTRCGYTGEDGFEISVPVEKAQKLAEEFLKFQVQPAGLGARDSLRLEAGLCLYGNDIDESTTPVEAGLTWTIGKSRREHRGFPGADFILKQLKVKPDKRRIGLTSEGPPPRSGMKILDENGMEVGIITSGCPSPTLGYNVAMGYVQSPLAKQGSVLHVKVRNKFVRATVTKMPFVPTKYFTG